MSTTVDERIVSMQFDNKNFEKNVGTTLSTLDKLKQKLNFTGASKGLEEVNAASKRVDMSTLGDGVEAVKTKFSALQVIAVTALANITNSAVNAGKRLVSSLTIDQVTAGWTKYEQKTSSVQTIMNATGKSIDEVSAYLDKLMWYSDETSYGFTDMTASLAQLTSAGGDIDKLIPMIEGVANATAFAGKGASEFSRAIYNLNQSYSAGYLQYMDWKSLDLAGVSSKQLKETLISTAEELGKIQKGQVTLDNFTETLKDKWADTEVMEKAFGKFAELTEAAYAAVEAGEYDTAADAIAALSDKYDDLSVKAFKSAQEAKSFTEAIEATKDAVSSGWMRTSEILFGDYEQAKELWTNLANTLWDVFASGADSRNELLDKALNSTGWGELLGEGIMDEQGYTYYIKEVAKEHGVAIDEMIEQEGSFEAALKKGLGTGELSSEMLSVALSRLSKDYDSFSSEQIENLGYTKDQVEALAKLNEEVQNGTISMEEFTEKIQKLSGRELLLESFSNIFKGIVSVITPIKEAFRDIFPATTADQLYAIIERFRDFTAKLTISEETSAKLRETFKGLFAALDIGLTIIKSVTKTAFNLVSTIFGLTGTILDSTSSFSSLILKLRDTIKESTLLASIGNIIVNVTQNVVNSIKNLVNALKAKTDSSLFESLGKVLQFVWDLTGKIFSKIAEITKSGDIFGFINNVLSSGILVGLIGLINKLKNMFGSFGDVASGFGNIINSITGPLEGLQQKLKAEALKNIAVAVAILAGSILVLSLIDPEKLDSSMAALTLAFGELIVAMKLMKKMDIKGVSGIGSIIGISSALLILSFALAKLSSLSWSEIGRGLAAMAGALAIMSGTLYLLSLISKDNMATKGAKQMNKMAIGLVILGGALKILATMSWSDIGRSLTAMTGALAIMTGTLYLLSIISKDNMATKGASQMKKMTVGLVILGGALKILATMSWNDIGRALTAMTGSLAVLSGTLYLMSTISKKGGSATTLVVVTTSLLILGGALKILATMGWDDIGRALTAMSVSLLVLVSSLLIMSKLSSGGASLIASAAALVVVAAAIGLLVPSLIILGKMKTETIVKGLLTMAAAFTVIGVAGLLLKSVVPTLLSFGAAIALVGVGVLAIGTGIGILAAGLAALITAIVAGGSVLVSTLLSLVKGIAELIPLIVQKLGEALIAFCGVLRDGAPILGEAIVAVLLSVIDALIVVVPQLAEGLLQIFIGVLDSLVQHIPTIVGYIFKILIGILNSIADYLPDLIQAAVNVFMSFFEGLVQALKNIDTETLKEGIIGVGLIAGLIAAIAAITPLIPGAMVGIAGMGVVIAELAVVLAAIGALAKIPGLTEIIAGGGNLLQTIGTAIGQFIGGIMGGIAQGFTSSLPAIGTDLSNFMTNLTPFLDGVKQLDSGVLENAKTLASLILVITAANIIESLTSWLTGGASMSDFANEVAVFGKGIKQFAEETAGIDTETVRAAAEAGKNLGEMAQNIPTSGGLWQLIAGKKDLSGFANQLKEFGKGVTGFAKEVEGIDGESVKASAEAGITLAQMAKNMPTSGGLWQLIAGKKDLSSFGSQLKEFGKGVKSFAESVSGVNLDTVDIGVKAGKEVATMAKNLPSSGGLWQLIAGKKDMGDFGTQLSLFGNAISNFVSEVNGIGDVSQTTATVNALNASLESFSTEGIKGMTESLTSARTKVVQLITNMLQTCVTVVTSKTSQFASAGKKFMTKFIDAIKSYSTKVKSAFSTVMKSAVSSIKNDTMYDKFYSAGKYLVQGLADGISENSYKVEAKAKAMANAAAQAARKALKINSPSKVFYEIGLGTGEGLINAEEDSIDQVYKSGQNIGQTLIEGMKYAAAKIKDVIENGVDQPTITPLLDLSNVTAGASAINGMFNGSPSVGVLSRVGSISASVNQNQNRGNSDVVTAIEDLKDTMKDNVGDTINIEGINLGSGDEELESAIKTLIRYANIERRR